MDQTLTMRREDSEEFEPPRRKRSRTVTFLVLVLALVYLAWGGLSFLELDTNPYTAALVALTPYAMLVGGLLTLMTLLLRRWLTFLVVAVMTGALALAVVPRAFPDPPQTIQGTPLRVMSANLFMGQVDAKQIVDLVRNHQVDVLSLQELDPEAVAMLDRAGLAELLPHRVFDTAASGAGTGIASRFPVRKLALVPPTTLRQPSALIDLPVGDDLEFVAVHPMIPVGKGTTEVWRREIRALPSPGDEESGRPRVLAGDFNATLDHTPLQELLGRGYEDVAEKTGDGLYPTWPVRDSPLPPPVTIDHVLTSGGVATEDFRVFDLDGGDHRAVLAYLVVPA